MQWAASWYSSRRRVARLAPDGSPCQLQHTSARRGQQERKAATAACVTPRATSCWPPLPAMPPLLVLPAASYQLWLSSALSSAWNWRRAAVSRHSAARSWCPAPAAAAPPAAAMAADGPKTSCTDTARGAKMCCCTVDSATARIWASPGGMPCRACTSPVTSWE